MSEGAATIADRRVHPGTIPIRFLKDAPSALIGLPAGISFVSGAGWATVLAVAGAMAVVGLGFAWLLWRSFRYGVGAEEIVIESGLLSHTRRSIPFDRVQDVDIERGPMQRLFGLAKVKIETGSGGKDEGLLDSVTLAEADRVRAAVRAWRTGDAPIVHHDTPAAPANRLLFGMPIPRVLIAGLFNFSLVYLAGLFAALQSFKGWLPFDIYDFGQWLGLVDEQLTSHFTPGAVIAVLLVAGVLGVLFGIGQTLLKDYDFKLWAEGERLRRERGLFTRTEVVLPKRRVQLARLRSGPLKGRFDWTELSFQTLSIAKDGGLQTVAPLAHSDEVGAILAEQGALRLPRPEELAMVSSGHMVRMLIEHVAFPAALFTGTAIFWGPGILLFGLLPLFIGVALIERRFHRYGLADGLLFIRRGVLKRQLWIVPVTKIQSIGLRRSLVQRWLGVATLAIDTAGASTMGSPRILDLRETRARSLLAQLSAAQLSGRKSGTERYRSPVS